MDESKRTDRSHPDTAHTDHAPSDDGQGDNGHSDGAHSDDAHSDQTHSDQTHSDQTHSDQTHSDQTHSDQTHGGARSGSAGTAQDADAVLAELTLTEKASLTIGADMWHTATVERVGIESVMLADGPHGMRVQLGRGDHAGLNESELATCFPPAVSLGCSWDPELAHRVGAAVGAEARALGASVVLGPGVNIKRSPLCGRNFEYFSEDPFLAGELGLGVVTGIQSAGVGASVKHFAANNQETDRLRVSAEVDERTLRELYLPAFERVVTAGDPWTVMCSYNKINGTYASQNHWLLTEVLRSEWGFDGLVVSDWGAVADRVAALAAGLDLEMPPNLEQSVNQVLAAVESGDLSVGDLDATVRRVLGLISRSGAARRHAPAVDFEAHHRLAREAAAASMVLLSNDGVLPLESLSSKESDESGTPVSNPRVAVIGEFARTPRYQGGGSSKVKATRVDTALAELTEQLAEQGTEVTFAPGFSLAQGCAEEQSSTLIDEAAAAAAAQVAVVFLGLPEGAESEGFDREHLRLPPAQVECLRRVEAVCERVVLVLAAGGAIEPVWSEKTSAVLQTGLSGQAGGGAVADILTGRVNPSGRLTETIAHRLADHPSSLNFPGDSHLVRYGEGLLVGYRGFDATGTDVAYGFGHGLSYTSFEHETIEVSSRGSVAGEDLAVTVRVRVRNTGERAGAEVVQVYVQPEHPSVTRPPRELKGFGRLTLQPGQSDTVELVLDARSFAHWSVETRDWVVDPGRYAVVAGPSSRNLPLTESVELAGTQRHSGGLDDQSSIDEWVEDDDGRAALQGLLGGEDGELPGWLGDPAMRVVVGNFPLKRFATFPGSPIRPGQVDELLAQLGR